MSRLPSYAPAALAALTIVVSGCGHYSFTGASIPGHLSSISVPQTEDNSLSTLNTMDEDLTELLLDRFVRQTRLTLQPDEQTADAILTTRIDRYSNAPTSVSGDERATLNRVTIQVFALYRDQREESDLISQTFSSFEEYDPTDPERGLSGEEDAARAVLQKIADDIFTAATSNW